MVLIHSLPDLSHRFVFLCLGRIIKSTLFLEVKISLLILVHELEISQARFFFEVSVVEALAELILMHGSRAALASGGATTTCALGLGSACFSASVRHVQSLVNAMTTAAQDKGEVETSSVTERYSQR